MLALRLGDVALVEKAGRDCAAAARVTRDGGRGEQQETVTHTSLSDSPTNIAAALNGR